MHKSPKRVEAAARTLAGAERAGPSADLRLCAGARRAILAEDERQRRSDHARARRGANRPLSRLAGPGVLASVGAYQIEGLGVHLFESIEGDHATILGLPMLKLLACAARPRDARAMSAVRTARAGVCGWPVAHSRSPLIHGYWLRRSASRAPTSASPCRRSDFADFAASIGRRRSGRRQCHRAAQGGRFRGLRPAHRFGANATGAVNTLWREDGALCGDNTDVAGFPRQSRRRSAPAGAAGVDSAVVLGAGGAARAIVYALLSRGVERVAIVNRTAARAEALAAQFGARGARGALGRAAALARARPISSSTRRSLGMAGQPPLDFDLAPLKANAVVADIVYVPLTTPLLEAARRRGLRRRRRARDAAAPGGAGLRTLVRRAPDGDARNCARWSRPTSSRAGKGRPT